MARGLVASEAAAKAQQRRRRRRSQQRRVGRAVVGSARQQTQARGNALLSGLAQALQAQSQDARRADRLTRRTNRQARRVIRAGGRDPRLPARPFTPVLQTARQAPGGFTGAASQRIAARQRQLLG